MFTQYKSKLQNELDSIKEQGLFKTERIIETPQDAKIKVNGKEVLNFCANNYLGLSSHPEVIKAAHDTLDHWGYGMSSVRFICGTQTIHKTLEEKISKFLGTEDTIIYAACFDANGGVFEPLLGEKDAIISDELNHASIIDGVRLCKAMRFRYKNNDMNDLEERLKEAKEKGAEQILICTDGAFSMDGVIANLKGICDLADKYQAMVMTDECHCTGFLGKTGRGSIEVNDVIGRVDIITGTLGKALGGAMGGFTSGRKEIIEMLRQRSRPYLFSNSLAPAIAGASIKVFDLLSETTELRDKLEENTKYFRMKISEPGFDIKQGIHPIVPVMLYDAKLSQQMAARLLEEGIYVIGFFYPVVAKGLARIRVQISAAHSREDLDKCIAAFTKVGKELKVI
ncbi:MAG TPA: glycine C-acetyltransferase [Ignavibacteria bacterium]|nr:glycine C-acetyltransferase [Ignavibacteria bacterium]